MGLILKKRSIRAKNNSLLSVSMALLITRFLWVQIWTTTTCGYIKTKAKEKHTFIWVFLD